ncbi:ParB/RepB/Spo0J family partition protein [bacterium]|nr:ParB/RepB/Spo0J family partition protein [bacterium]MBU4560751.1 ParB/RepB/Spo0J family partition protein [bacterium]MCG2676044.1 ParB/RepB/Spo0J family partition protein [bacterium]MCG2677911.1 ParB/RepB/Spo0J family partition protein [bacterium]
MIKKALGRGLAALIPELGPVREDNIIEAKLSSIRPNRFQPREEFNPQKLEELVSSIKEKGVIQPVLARIIEGGYELITGERRLRAAKKLGLEKIPLIVKEVSDTEMLELALIENLQRENLNPMEEAHAYRRVIKEFKIKQEDLAREIGKDQATVANSLRLLKLPKEVQKEISKGNLSRGHGVALLSLEKAPLQIRAARKVRKNGLSVRATEDLVNRLKGKVIIPPKKGTAKPPEILAVEEELNRALGTKVRIKPVSEEKGRIEIEYYSSEQLEGILEKLRGKKPSESPPSV